MLGFTLPALFGAHYIHGRANHKPFLFTICAISRIGVLTLPPALLFWGKTQPGLALAWFFVVWTLFWGLDGATVVSWFDIIGKAIPARVRGRFFGTMQMISGLLAMSAGLVVTRVLDPRGIAFPANFALLAVFWCVGAWLSQIGLGLLREPPGVVEGEDEKPPFMAFVRRAPVMLRANRRLSLLIVARLFIEGAGMAAPFYILYAQRDLHSGLKMVGVYAMVQSAGSICAGPLWGWISDRFGPIVGLRGVAAAITLVPLSALLAGGGAVWVFPAVFFLIGAAGQGLWMVASSALLESVEAQERPFAVGVSSIFQSPAALYPFLGGLIAQAASYRVVFSAALLFAAVGLLLTLRLSRPGRVER